jgi:hypothetical protein
MNLNVEPKIYKMIKKVYLVLFLCCLFATAQGQFSVVLIDSLTEGIQFTDNNFFCLPEGYDEPIPAFHIVEKTDDAGLSFPAISLTDSVVARTWMTGAFNALDYYFPEIVRNTGDTLKIEFDLMVQAVSGSGETGRMNMTLLTSATGSGPFTGIQFPLATNFEEPPVSYTAWREYAENLEVATTKFGAPTYHLWLFSGNYGPALAYGGDFPRWPGWNSGAGGYYYNRNAASPNTAVDYNSSDNYPLVPYSKKQPGPGVSATTWKHYTWLITDQMIRLYWRDSKQGPEDDVEIVFMAIPKNENDIAFINEAHGTSAFEMPPEYKWYERMSGLRFWHSQNNRNVYLSNIVFTKTGTPVSTYAEFQNLPATRRRVRADADGFNLPVLLYNGTDGVATTVTLDLIKGDAGHVDGFTSASVTFPENTGGEMTLGNLPLTLTDMYKTENDTLTFRLTDIEGGYYPTIGANRTFELVIRPSGATPPTGITDNSLQDVRVYPNPASTFVVIENLAADRNTKMVLYDVTGKLLSTQICQGTARIDISNLEQGVYFMKLTANDGSITKKIIKQ